MSEANESPQQPSSAECGENIEGILSISRRAFLQSSALIAGSLAAPALVAQTAGDAKTSGAATTPSPASVRTSLHINGRNYDLTLEPRTTLLDTLREYAGLPGTKKGCDRGQCGACTVLVNGRRINSCMTLAVMHQGDDIVTIEGIGQPDNLHPLQAAFIEYDGFQCGYCTPGQICSAFSLLSEIRNNDASAVTPDVRSATVQLTDDEIRERMSGNICRCGAYPNIVKAIRSVATSRA